MAIKIIIKRRVAKDKVKELMPLLKELRTLAMNQPGYIGGETLKRLDDPDEYLVISSWQNEESWRSWVDKKERMEIQSKIDSLLEQNTEYAIYRYG